MAAASGHWDAHARVYERVWERSTLLWGRDALVLGQLPDPPNGARLLDVACGSGALALHAAALGFDVTAVDASPAMIACLDTKLEIAATSTSPPLQVSTLVTDGHTLDGLHDRSFDVACSNFGVFLFPDRAAAWQSMWRVLKPGGQVLATSWDADNVNVRLIHYLVEHAQDLPPNDFDGSRATQPIVTPAVNRTMAPDSFRDELAECGFEAIRVHTVCHTMCFTSGEELVEGVLDNASFLALVGHKQRRSLQHCILDFAQRELASISDNARDGSSTIGSNIDAPVESHVLWTQPIALLAVAHVAVATKSPTGRLPLTIPEMIRLAVRQ